MKRFALILLVSTVLAASQSLPDWLRQAAALKARGDAAGALNAYQEAARLGPPSAEIQDEIGFLLAVLKRPGEALEHFREAVRLDPNFAPARYHLGVALWLGGDRNAALEELRAAARLKPAEFDYRYRLGEALSDAGRHGEA